MKRFFKTFPLNSYWSILVELTLPCREFKCLPILLATSVIDFSCKKVRTYRKADGYLKMYPNVITLLPYIWKGGCLREIPMKTGKRHVLPAFPALLNTLVLNQTAVSIEHETNPTMAAAQEREQIKWYLLMFLFI